MNRFDYIEYDGESQARQKIIKDAFVIVEGEIRCYVECPRSKEKAMSALEEAYMWTGKGIRNDQQNRLSLPPKLKEERTNS